jgi:hypothetical protein
LEIGGFYNKPRIQERRIQYILLYCLWDPICEIIPVGEKDKYGTQFLAMELLLGWTIPLCTIPVTNHTSYKPSTMYTMFGVETAVQILENNQFQCWSDFTNMLLAVYTQQSYLFPLYEMITSQQICTWAIVITLQRIAPGLLLYQF